jgi:hypothetical protein
MHGISFSDSLYFCPLVLSTLKQRMIKSEIKFDFDIFKEENLLYFIKFITCQCYPILASSQGPRISFFNLAAQIIQAGPINETNIITLKIANAMIRYPAGSIRYNLTVVQLDAIVMHKSAFQLYLFRSLRVRSK